MSVDRSNAPKVIRSTVLTRRKKRQALESGDPIPEVDAQQLRSLIEEEQNSQQKTHQDSHESSQKCAQTEAVDEKLYKKLDDCAWVQCENLECLKWRRISKEDVIILGDTPWYCFMNTNTSYNCCDDPEEDYPTEEKLASKMGLKYITSCLQEGTLVWAKMSGFCRWPAIISRDPVGGDFMSQDCTGEILSYHVEYLGDRHSHSWIAARHVELYGWVEKPSKAKSVSKSISQGKPRGHHKRSLIEHTKHPERQVYRKNTVDSAIAEANTLLEMLPHSRLSKLTFVYVADSEQKDPDRMPQEKKQKEMTDCTRKIRHFPKAKTQKTSQGYSSPRKRGRRKKSESESQSQQVPNLEKNIKQKSDGSVLTNLEAICTDIQKSARQHLKVRLPSDSQQVPEHSPVPATATKIKEEPLDLSPKVLGKIESVPTEVKLSQTISLSSPGSSICGSPRVNFTQQLNEKVSLVDKTKEEKLQLDVQLYARNEKAFEHDVRRFLLRNEMNIKSLPVWQNTPVSLFQLFLAVRERGGYEQVSKKRGWKSLYQELVGGSMKGGGQTAKNYYTKNLLPYELYLAGKDYSEVLRKYGNDNKKRTTTSTTSSSTAKAIKPKGWKPPPSNTNNVSSSQIEQKPIIQPVPVSIGCPLPENLTKHENNQFDLSPGCRDYKKMRLEVKFYDDSPEFKPCPLLPSFNQVKGDVSCTKEADAACGHANLPVEGAAHEVPDIGYVTEETEESGSDGDEQVLHELEAVQQQVDAYLEEKVDRSSQESSERILHELKALEMELL